MSINEPVRSVRAAEGAKILGVGTSTFWRYAKSISDFPKARRLTKGATVFDVAELIAWRDARAHQPAARTQLGG